MATAGAAMTDRADAARGPYGPRFGIVTPMGNPCAEPELSILTGAAVMAARAVSPSGDSRTRLVDYIDQIGPCLARFDGTRVDAYGFACTCYYLRGPVAEAADTAALADRFGAPVITSTQAIRRMAARLGVTKIALLAPYPTWLATEAKRYFEAVACPVVSHVGLPKDLVDTRGIFRLTPDDVAECADRLDLGDAQAVVIGGTGMPSLHFLAAWAGPVPAFSANIALAAALLEEAGDKNGCDTILAADARWRSRLRLWGGSS